MDQDESYEERPDRRDGSQDPWTYVGSCPRCGSGLARIRLCGVATRQMHGLVVCDECEAIWLNPDLEKPPIYSRSEVAQSPRTGESIWDPPNRWATLEDIGLLGWFDRIVIESDDD
jgi:hypothetical protein